MDGFFALGLDNLLMMILMTNFCLGFPLFMPPEVFYGQVLPATAIGLVIGNVYYARQALQLAKRTGRNDVCALPYGISIITLVAFTFLVMFPAKLVAQATGQSPEEAALTAWKAGCLAAFGNGLIEFCGSFAIRKIRNLTPRAALLAAVGGIGLTFVAMDSFYRIYAFPIVGFSTLAIAMIFYFGKIPMRFGLPPGVVLVAVGLSLCWIMHWFFDSNIVPVGSLMPEMVGLQIPQWVFGDILNVLPDMLPYLSIILTMGLINVVLSMQNVESAEAAGDPYDPKSSLLFNGLGSMGAGLFGSPYPATIYVGHPGWKGIGARAGYSTLNAIAISLIAFSGTLSFIAYVFPFEAGMAIIVWSGLIICSQAFEQTPRRHTPAVLIGIIPALSAYASLILKRGFQTTGFGTSDQPIPQTLTQDFARVTDFHAEGLFALEAGYVYSSMILAATTVCIIDHRFRSAGAWLLVGALFSALGLIHQFSILQADIVSSLQPGWEWVIGYLIFAALCFAVPWITPKGHQFNVQHENPQAPPSP